MTFSDADSVVNALRRLYSGDAVASRELEAFQSSPGAQAIALELLKSVVAEVQFFAASTICRIATCAQEKKAADVDWLLAQACNCAHQPAARQLVMAAAALVGPEGAHTLGVRAVDILASDAHWQVALELLLALSPAPPLSGVCASLSKRLGQGSDEKLLTCALRYPGGLAETSLSCSLEDSVRKGCIREIPDACNLPAAYCQRLFAAALVAIEGGHLDAAASVLHDLPSLGLQLLEPAEYLLRAQSVSTRMAAVDLWSHMLRQLKDPQQCKVAFDRFAPSFFVAAAWADDEDMCPLRDSLWTLAREWQLATPARFTLLEKGFEELQQALQSSGDWRRAEAALWVLSKYAQGCKSADVERAVDVCLLVLREMLTVSNLEPLTVSACALLEALPCVRALPILLDRRLGDAQSRSHETRSAVAAAVRSCCEKCRDALWADGTAQRVIEELQSRALAGEEGLVAAAAQLMAAKDVRLWAEQWAKLCAEAPPGSVGPKARGLFGTIVQADICLSLWRDCANMLPHVPQDEQVQFVVRVAAFARDESALLAPATELWVAVWARAEGDEDLVAALEGMVRASARTSATVAPAMECLVRSFPNSYSWAPQVQNAALYIVVSSVAPAGSPWPLTLALMPTYAFVLQHAAAISSASEQAASALSLVGALSSWGDDSEIGRGLRGCLRTQEQAVRTIVSKSESSRVAQRIAQALGL